MVSDALKREFSDQLGVEMRHVLRNVTARWTDLTSKSARKGVLDRIRQQFNDDDIRQDMSRDDFYRLLATRQKAFDDQLRLEEREQASEAAFVVFLSTRLEAKACARDSGCAVLCRECSRKKVSRALKRMLSPHS